ncbi:MAG: hypothetical protein J6R82_06910 [Clostridia bacterium]|nr:hypothetical protein [Clostridia bacterium]
MDKQLYSEFKKVSYILDHCYFASYNFALGGILGELSCDLWEDGSPADTATYEDLIQIIEGVKEYDSVHKALFFLETYSAQTGFDFDSAIAVLKVMSDEQIAELNCKANCE